jgi:hypothetical protein
MKTKLSTIAFFIGFLIVCSGAAGTLNKIKPLQTDSALFPTASDYMIVLERFPMFAEYGWHDNYQGHSNVGYWGNAYSGEMGQRPQANFIVAYALMAREKSYDPTVSGVTQDTLRSRALDGLRYMTRTHFSGDLKCTDGKPWGNAWQSAYWTARMGLGAYLLWPHLTSDERTAVRRVLAAEADLLPRKDRPITGLLDNTRSEENAWDTEGLAWALKLCPDHPHRDHWRYVLDLLAMNTLTTEADLASETIVAGSPVKEWVKGVNIHSDYSIENHGYFHFCYMACPLHSFAWDWLCWSLPGIEGGTGAMGPWPESLDFHALDLMNRIKKYYLYDGRFAYAGGKEWPRYAYGLYFIMPVLVQHSQQHGDGQSRMIEGARLRKFDEEQRIHNDGSFYSGRFTDWVLSGRKGEWETDTAGHLSVCYLLHTLREPIPSSTLDEYNRAHNGSHKSPSRHVMVRGDKRFASWSYKSAAGPLQGILIGSKSEDLAEWDYNLYGRVEVEGDSDTFRLGKHCEEVFDGGFVATLLAYEDVDSRYSLVVNDSDGWNHRILAATHPIFNTPNKVPDIKEARAYDTISQAGPGWQVLAEDEDHNPSILLTSHGKGTLLICQMNAEEMVYSGSRGGKELFVNLISYLTNGKTKPNIALFGQEDHAQRALAKLNMPAKREKSLNSALDAAKNYDLIILERSRSELSREWSDVLDYVAGGGMVLKFLVQDRGWQPGHIANNDSFGVRHYTSVVALPDDASLVKLDRLVAGRDIGSVTVKDLRWRVVNDVFNDQTRTFHHEDGNTKLQGVGGKNQTLQVASRWLNVDDLWGLVCLDDEQGIALVDTSERKSGFARWLYSILAESILTPSRSYAGPHKAGSEVARYGALMMVDQDHENTSKIAKSKASFREIKLANRDVFCVRVSIEPGQSFLIVSNYGDTAVEVELPSEVAVINEITKDSSGSKLSLKPLTTRVFSVR